MGFLSGNGSPQVELQITRAMGASAHAWAVPYCRNLATTKTKIWNMIPNQATIRLTHSMHLDSA